MSEGNHLSDGWTGEEVVISGISGSFPDSRNVYEFWDNLYNKVDMVSGDERRGTVGHPEIPKRYGKLYDVQKFDAGFFGWYYRQTQASDPTFRIVMEKAMEAVMDAGINPSELEGSRTAVFVGMCYSDSDMEWFFKRNIPQYCSITGNEMSIIGHRISYFFKLIGPCTTTDTACSSSLYALENAYNAIKSGICDSAIVASANLCLNPAMMLQFARLGVVGSDGKSKVFDDNANGYARSETIGAFFVQKAKRARRIYGKIINIKTNCDGYKEQGITFPSSEMQARLLKETYEDCNVDPMTVTYMEAHGTGTQVGDPEEVRAIASVLLKKKRDKPLLIGSVKSNIGHSEASAGHASVTKVLVAMENDVIPPNIHFTKPREGVEPLHNGQMKVVTEPTRFAGDTALIGVNGFGFGGANCHVVLQGNPQKKSSRVLPNDDLPRLICVSGRTENAIVSILDDIKRRPLDVEYVKLFHQVFGKEIVDHLYRGFLIMSKTGEVRRSCNFLGIARKPLQVTFTDFGDRWATVARDLMSLQLFADSIKKIDEIFGDKGFNVSATILNCHKKTGNVSNVDNTVGSAVVQLAIVAILKKLGVKPDGFSSSGVTDLVRGYFDGSLTLKQAVLTIRRAVLPDNSSKSDNVNIKSKKTIGEGSTKFWSTASLVNNSTNNTSSIQARKGHISLNIGLNHFSNVAKRVKYLSFDGTKKENAVVTFLEILGSLYESGCNFNLAILYPEVRYPVCRGTPMISPLIKWDHSKDWIVVNYTKAVTNVKEDARKFGIKLNSEEWEYISGHVIDGRNLFPATGYLYLVWLTLTNSSAFADLQVVFENCKFIRAYNMPADGTTELTVRIQRGTRAFEVLEYETLLVSGYVKMEEISYAEMLPNDEEILLDSKDIYKELRLRGYNYKGAFRLMQGCTQSGSKGFITWSDNLVSFMDNMLQMKILEKDTRSLYVPTGIKRLSIDSRRHIEFAKSFGPGTSLPVLSSTTTNLIRCGGIEIRGLQATSIPRRNPRAVPVLEKYQFVPNHLDDVATHQSIRINMQLILENNLSTKVKVVELIDEATETQAEPLGPLVHQVLEDLPLIKPDITILSSRPVDLEDKVVKVQDKKLVTETDCDLVIGSKLLKRNAILAEALTAIKPDGYVLSRESCDFDETSCVNINVLTLHVTKEEKLVLVKKNSQLKPATVVDVTDTSDEFFWLSNLQHVMATTNKNVLVVAQNQPLSGVLGLVNCIRKEPGGNTVRCVFTFGSSPRFDPDNPFYRDQLKKDLAINVYKNSQWGTYKHLLLDNALKIEREHCWVNTTSRGDLSTLKWLEGPLSKSSVITPGYELVYVYYAPLNFRDIMLATGKLNADSAIADRTRQECVTGFEFAGRNARGERVIGMGITGAVATMVEADSDLTFPIPDNWTLEEAATVPVVYGTVLYAFFTIGRVKRGDTILIHAGSGGVGQAAINIAHHYNCEVYTTVGTKEKRDFLLKQFPHLKADHIGNSRDTSFEQMIYRQTNGRGVDVVLNSLAEEKLIASVRCLAIGGTFLEIGKFDLASDNTLALALLKKEASFHGVMLDAVFLTSEEGKLSLGKLLSDNIKNGAIKPIVRTVFTMDQVETAFRYMATGKHVGKVLIKVRSEEKEKVVVPPVRLYQGVRRYCCTSQKVYVILGGLGGFGLELADWLVLKGARKIVLTSRSGVKTGYQAHRIKIWESYGTLVRISTADITTKKGCQNLIKEANSLGVVEAIFNLAVVLRDAILENQTPTMFKESFAPKARATEFLDEISRTECPQLKDFVIFSSVSCGRGNAGQINYGMANSIMERICEKRKAEGLPALAIEWGAVGDVGLVAEMQEEHVEMEIGGTLQQRISNCLQVMDCLMRQDCPIVSSMVVAEKKSGSGSSDNILVAVANIIGIHDIKTISMQATLPEIGMDSMSAVEIKQTLETDFDVFLSPQDIRTLTFARLQELQEEKQSESVQVSPVKAPEIDFKAILLNLSQETASDSHIVRVASMVEDQNVKDVVFLPGVEGAPGILQPLASKLRFPVNCFQYSNDTPNGSVEDVAKTYYPEVRAMFSKTRPFRIIAYSYGTLVALEMVRLLEEEGYQGLLISLDGTPQMMKLTLSGFLNLGAETLIETTLLTELLSLYIPRETVGKHKTRMLECPTFEDRLKVAEELTPKDFAVSMTFIKKLAEGLLARLTSVGKYEPKTKLKSTIKLYKASIVSTVKIEGDGGLSQFCQNPVEIQTFTGNHVTFLESEELAQALNEIILPKN